MVGVKEIEKKQKEVLGKTQEEPAGHLGRSTVGMPAKKDRKRASQTAGSLVEQKSHRQGARQRAVVAFYMHADTYTY